MRSLASLDSAPDWRRTSVRAVRYWWSFGRLAHRRTHHAAQSLEPSAVSGPGVVGAWFDLQCVPLADGSVRFTSHGDYVSRVVRQANSLQRGGYLLEADAEALEAQAAESEVGLH